MDAWDADKINSSFGSNNDQNTNKHNTGSISSPQRLNISEDGFLMEDFPLDEPTPDNAVKEVFDPFYVPGSGEEKEEEEEQQQPVVMEGRILKDAFTVESNANYVIDMDDLETEEETDIVEDGFHGDVPPPPPPPPRRPSAYRFENDVPPPPPPPPRRSRGVHPVPSNIRPSHQRVSPSRSLSSRTILVNNTTPMNPMLPPIHTASIGSSQQHHIVDTDHGGDDDDDEVSEMTNPTYDEQQPKQQQKTMRSDISEEVTEEKFTNGLRKGINTYNLFNHQAQEAEYISSSSDEEGDKEHAFVQSGYSKRRANEFARTRRLKIKGRSPKESKTKVSSMYENEVPIDNIRDHDDMDIPDDERVATRQQKSMQRKASKFSPPAMKETPPSPLKSSTNKTSSPRAFTKLMNSQTLMTQKKKRMGKQKMINTTHLALPAVTSATQIDPIQAAGLRLLNQAAIPIQAIVRRHLAQVHAVNRYLGILKLQSIFRRWNCEELFLGARYAATLIQALFRGSRCYRNHQRNRYNAIVIQKYVRRHQAILDYGESMWAVLKIQSFIRMGRDMDIACWRLASVICIQAHIRKFLVRKRHILLNSKAVVIQSAWRGYIGYFNFLHSLADVLIVQSVVRRFLAMKVAHKLKFEKETNAATIIQKHFRGYIGFTNYLFDLNDIITTQACVRRFLAISKAARLRDKLINASATTIQSSWRRFWGYSHFVITRYEITLFQALVRGHLTRQQLSMEVFCATMIQAQYRSYHAMKMANELRLLMLVAQSAKHARLAQQGTLTLQRWWRSVIKRKEAKMDAMRRRAAARVILRFFLTIKADIDREFRRQMERQRRKEERKRLKKKKREEQMLDKLLMRTVTNNPNQPIAGLHHHQQSLLPQHSYAHGGVNSLGAADNQYNRKHHHNQSHTSAMGENNISKSSALFGYQRRSDGSGDIHEV